MSIDTYGIMASVVQLAADCVNDDSVAAPCRYRTFVGLGIPPADCSLISASWGRDRVMKRRDRCYTTVRSEFYVYLTRCCLKNNREEFDPATEDEDAACFHADFDALRDCLLCDVKATIGQHGLACDDEIIEGAIMPDFTQGGCFGARFTIGFDWIRKCC